VASGVIYRRVTIRSGPSSLMMANHIKIKRVVLIQSCIAMAAEGNWIPEE